jgi:hypothetical protein
VAEALSVSDHWREWARGGDACIRRGVCEQLAPGSLANDAITDEVVGPLELLDLALGPSAEDSVSLAGVALLGETVLTQDHITSA